MADPRPTTILHLSDIQFGRNHRFGWADPKSPDDAFDTLLSRVQKDLDLLARDNGLKPDLIALTGDLAEWGLKSEFEDVAKFAQGLCESTGLPRSRVVLLPGNHDINRSASEAYFLECKSEEQDPVKPFWPKWKHFRAFFDEFYKDLDPRPAFTEDAPWSLFVFDDLKVVVAGLNSTMAESHQEADHYGHLGEKQLNWFADKLARYRRDGWLRIAAVHHNVLRNPTRDDENLRDANDLDRLLGELVNCVLHGHTHDGKLGFLLPDLPVFATGSAAVNADARPPEIPNQYQFIQFWPGKFIRWTRGYAPDRKQWIGDNRASRDGSDWRQEQPIQFRDTHGTFPTGAEPQSRLSGDSGPAGKLDLDRSLSAHRSEDFLSRLAEVHRVRLGNACSIERMEAGLAGLPYLRVIEKTEFGGVLYPVAGAEFGVTVETLSRFRELHRRYRDNDRWVASVLVYGGAAPPAPEVEQIASVEGFQLKSFIEFQGLIDFAPYLAVQSRRLAADMAYPPSLYVPQRAELEIGEERRPVEDALVEIRAFLGDPRSRLVLILGSFGTGKTFLLKELARRIEAEHGSLAPILVEMRALEKARTLAELLAQHFARLSFDRFDLPAVRYMIEQGRVALLFDGFDELALRVASYDRAAEHLQTVIEAAGGNAKIVITSRTQHFESDQQVKTALRNRIEIVPGLRIARLQPFDKPKIRQYLTKLLGNERKADARFKLIEDIEDLMGLSANPRMLSFIAEIDEQELQGARDRSGKITSASLYRMILGRWIDFELNRTNPRGAPASLQAEVIWKAVTELAFSLWRKTDPTVSVDELVEESGRTLQILGDSRFRPEQAAHQVGSGSLLVRDEEGRFSFIHQSVMEWLVAQRVASLLPSQEAIAGLAEREISPLMADFIGSLSEDREKLVDWARAILRGDAASQAKANVELVLNRLGVTDLFSVRLAGATLRGADFSERDLSDADFSRADLTEARFVGATLRRANLAGAHLAGADFGKADLAEADLSEADLTGASLLGAKMPGAKLNGTVLHRARLVGADLNSEALGAADHFGAALPRPLSVQPFIAFQPYLRAITWSPDGKFLGITDQLGVLLLDAMTGLPLRRYEGHAGELYGLAFSPDGSRLATASADKTLALWDVASGELLRRYEGHSDWVRGVVFSPGGNFLASASDDKTLALWDVASGRVLRRYEGHSGWVMDVAFSPDGSRLASASADKTAALWDVATGGLVQRYEGHSGVVNGVAFSPDGSRLASASDDKTVALWDGATGGLVQRYEGHSGVVNGVAFSPDGSRLASASDDKTVALWDVVGGQLVRRCEGHSGGVTGLAFSPDGSRLASASEDDRTVALWDVASAGLMRRYEGHSGWVLEVAFSPDGSSLASASTDKTCGTVGFRKRRAPAPL